VAAGQGQYGRGGGKFGEGTGRDGIVMHTGLLGTLGEVLDGPPGLENRRKGKFSEGCPAAIAGARAPASRRLGQVDPCASGLFWRRGKG
jgi:hypothetical protein